MSNPFGDTAVSENPFGDKPLEGNPFGDKPKEQPSYLGAAGTHLWQGIRQGVGGTMQAGGELVAPKGESLEEAAAGVVGAGAKSFMDVQGAPSMAYKMLEQGANSARKALTRLMIPEDSGVAEAGRYTAEVGKDLVADASGKIKEGTPEGLNMVQEAGLSALSSTGQMLPWLAAARAGVRPGFVQAGALSQFGGQAFGQTYGEARAKGAEPEEAMKAALASSGAEVLGEKLGLDTLLKRGPGWFKSYLLKEIGGEEFTTAVQSMAEKGYYNPEKWSSGGEILHDMAVTSMAAAGGATMIKGVDKGLDLFVKEREAREFDAEAATREMQQALARSAGIPEEELDAGTVPLPPLTDLTPEERAMAALQREQLKNGLQVEPSPSGVTYGLQLRNALAQNGLGLPRVEEDTAEDVGGMTPEVLERRERTKRLNGLPFDLRPITISNGDQGVVGLTLQQTGELPKGAVVAVGEDQELFPGEVFQPVLDTLGAWVQRYMPEAQIVLNLEQLPEGAFGAHAAVTGASGRITHVITPRELPSFKYSGGDVKTRMALVTALSHEFGHALKVQNFLQGVKGLGVAGANALKKGLAAGQVGEEILAAMDTLAPEEAALVRGWQDLRGRVLAGELTAKEFMEQWVGTRKLGDSVNPARGARNVDLMSWAKDQLGKKGKVLESSTALDLIDAAYEGGADYALNFDEYMAEQFSRAAYASGDLELGGMGRLFKSTIDALRNLFRTLKAEKVIAPNETFQAWLDKQTARAAGMKKPSGKFRLQKGVREAQKAILGRVQEKEKVPEAAPPAPEVKVSRMDAKSSLEDLLYSLESAGRLSAKQLERYLEKLEYGQMQAVRESLQRLLGDEYNEDREYSSTVLQRMPDKKKLKVETLKATIAQQGVKEQEKAFWQRFMAEHPEGFSKQEMEEALRDNMVPLEESPTLEFARHGLHVLESVFESKSFGWLRPDAVTIVWRNEDFIAGERAQKHFKDQHALAHTRRADFLGRGERFVLELQSDLFQEGEQPGVVAPEIVTTLEDYRMMEGYQRDLLNIYKEILGEGAVEELGREWELTKHAWPGRFQKVVVATPEDMLALLPELQTEWEDMQGLVRDGERIALAWTRQAEGRVDLLKEAGTAWWERLIREEVAAAVRDGKTKLLFPTAETVAAIEGWDRVEDGTFGEQQGLADLYKFGVGGYVKRKYKAVPVQLGEHSWLEVDLSGKTEVVTNWDRENPLQPRSPGVVLDTFAGVTDLRDAGQVEEALAQWEKHGKGSPFFKRWFTGSQVVGMDQAPLGVFSGPGLGGQFPALWFSDNVGNAQLGAQEGAPGAAKVYLQLRNPLVVDLGGEVWGAERAKVLGEQALAGGHDGLVVKGVLAPLEGNLYAVFSEGQVAQDSEGGKLDETGKLHWDAESTGQQAARTMSVMLQRFWGKGKLTAINTYAKVVDTFAQLQQVAASQPDAVNLQSFMRKWGKALQLKNNLQLPAEELVKELAQITGSGKARVRALHRVLIAEWKTGELQGKLVGLDRDGHEVWGEEAGVGLAQQAQVFTWKVQDTLKLREFMLKHGVDVRTEEGKHVLELYLKTRELFLFQFQELGNTLKVKAAQTYAGQPLLVKEELVKINGLMTKLLTSPFVPQGNFGNYVLVVKKDMGPQGVGKRRYHTVFRRHYEKKADFDKAYLLAQAKAGLGSGLQVSSQELTEQEGLPMQLPRDLLEMVGQTGEFAPHQIELLESLMTVSKYDRIAERFEGISKQVAGGEEDFVRVLADFAGRNANYIWKMRYRFEMQQSISAEKHQVRKLEKDPIMAPGQKLDLLNRKRRNIALMEKGLDYVISPGNELQALRSFITLVYLGYNVKTALMNVSTQINTLAAVTSEYGELDGMKEWGRSQVQAMQLMVHKGEGGKALKGEELNELHSVLDQAIRDGVVDQSYAYFLAANANASPLLAATGGRISHAAHTVAELGMLPFQTMEKFNRVHSLITFYKLERKKFGAGSREAYDRAVEKTALLQNAYDAMNRPSAFRGKKAILTMFMSYTQFMWYMSTGGYERGARAQARGLGREYGHWVKGPTAKLWLLYLFLGGLSGVPFGRNLMDVIQWAWRKLGFGNMEVELRTFLEELGVDANFALHGLMHDVLGFDLSGSFGLGRMLPGTDLLTKERELNTLETMGSLLTTASGPAGSFYKGVTEAIGHLADDPTNKWGWMNAGKSVPGAIGSVTKAVDAKLRQEYMPTYGVTLKDGRRMTWDKETGEFRDLTTKELAGQALGFTPTLLAENREQNFALMSEVFYWQTRRSDLMDRHWQAIRSGDEELRLEVRDAIGTYNDSVPERQLQISGKDLRVSVRSHQKQVKKGEEFGSAMKMFKGRAEEVRGAYLGAGD